MSSICSHCTASVSPEMNFCPNCGKKIKELLPSNSLGSQIVVYLISFFLPPLGFWYAYKYLKHGDQSGKKIGYVAIILTIVSAVLTVWSAEALIGSVNQSLQGLNF